MSSRDILPFNTSASLAESNTSSSPPLATTSSAERTSTLPSDAAPKWSDPSCPLAWDHAGDPTQDPLLLPDLEPEPTWAWWARGTLSWSLNVQPVPEPKPEEEEELDCEQQRGEGDLVCLHLVGEYTTGEMAGDVGGMPSPGHLSATHLGLFGHCRSGSWWTCAHYSGRALPPVLQKISSFSTSMAFLWLSGGGVCVRSRLWSPNHGHWA